MTSPLLSDGPLYAGKLTCYQGIDFLKSFLFFGPPGNGSTDVQDLAAVDFTGCTARMAIRRAQDPASVLLLSLTTGGGGLVFIADTFTPGPPVPAFNNGLQIKITAAQSLAMDSTVALRDAYYDVIVDRPDTTSMLLMSGAFDLAPTVTR